MHDSVHVGSIPPNAAAYQELRPNATHNPIDDWRSDEIPIHLDCGAHLHQFSLVPLIWHA